MLEQLNGIAFLWLLLWTFLALKNLVAGRRNSIFIVIIVHFLFSGIPLLLDIVIGQPTYSRFPGFRMSIDDETTSLIYCLYISAIPPFWWWLGRSKISNQSTTVPKSIISSSLLMPILYLLIISPLIVVLLAPEPSIYFNYALMTTEDIDIDVAEYYRYISIATVLSLIGITGILSSMHRIKLSIILFLLPWFILAVWLNGKRYIIAFAIFLFGYVFWSKGYLVGKKLIIAIAIAISLIGVFSYAYQVSFRASIAQVANPDFFYENIRQDYGRDHVMKMTIFAELYPEKIQILNYRGESIVFNLTMFVPRSLWTDKPFTYAQYLTSAVFQTPPKYWDWGFTTSCLEEAIANFSWFGMIIGPLIPLQICRVGDSSKNNTVAALTTLNSSLMLTVQLSAFVPLFFLWIILVVLTNKMNKKSRYNVF